MPIAGSEKTHHAKTRNTSRTNNRDSDTMKLARFTLLDDPARLPRLGVVNDDGIHNVTALTERLPALRWPYPPGDQLIGALASLRPHLENAAAGPLLELDAISLLSPVANPGKFVCGAGNWRHHGAPLGMSGFMFKASSANAGPGEGVQIRWPDRVTLYEPELAIVIGRTCSNVSVAEALDHVAGYCCALDMTLQRAQEDYAFCKSFDSYGMLGPWLTTADEVPDPAALSYRFTVNGELRGERRFADLTGGPAELVAFASSAMTLHPGDAILSGAADVAPVAPGDVMALEIPGLGTLETTVAVSPLARG
jgi:2-keto-4-pentenoate hydratase/2-oxohepta-3-ene-1,7-dioic acid hydratase in catechol pathway